MLIDIRPRIAKPAYGLVEVERSHPLANGLITCLLMNSGAGKLIDLAHSNRVGMITDPANVTWGVGDRGVAIISTASLSTTPGVTFSPAISIASGAPFSWDCLMTPIIGDTYGTVLTQAAARGIYFMGTGAGAPGRINLFTVADHASGTSVTSGTTHHFGLTATGTSVTFYLDGKADGTSSYTAISLDFDTMFNDTLSGALSGKCYFQRVWNRAITAGEMALLAKEPYAFLRPRLAIKESFMRSNITTATTVFRRTLSAHGTRTGSRQVHF